MVTNVFIASVIQVVQLQFCDQLTSAFILRLTCCVILPSFIKLSSIPLINSVESSYWLKLGHKQ